MNEKRDDLPYVRRGKYGVIGIDYAACGSGYVVHFECSKQVRETWGEKSCWYTFQSFHTALAYFYALHGRADDLYNSDVSAGRYSTLSKNPVPQHPSAAEPHRRKSGAIISGRRTTNGGFVQQAGGVQLTRGSPAP